jgi:hypothetical protein
MMKGELIIITSGLLSNVELRAYCRDEWVL